ncbi:MAG: hypothetical protein N2508_06875 [Anaerolineae bacterium]|nr:hypothetical protein [Anaerolineae bacterium]
MRKSIFSVGLVLALLISSCGADPEVQVVEISKNNVVYDEIVRLNNCGGKGDSDHTATREFATTIEFGAGISAGYKSIVEGNLSAKYSEYRNTSKSLRVIAPPGTNMEFVLRWSDDVRAGNVQVNGKSGTYEVRIPIAVEQISGRDLGCGILLPQPTQSSEVVPTVQSPLSSYQTDGPFREHKQTPIVGTGVLAQGTYSDGMAPFDDAEILQHLNIQRIRLEENPDGCAIAAFNAEKIWFGSSVKTSLTINEVNVGTINGPTGKHGYIFDVRINAGDKICVTYFESSGFHIFLGPDLYYHYDSYCYRGHCR